MNWADLILRCLLKKRDRATISGDLLEEYREEVVQEKGRFGAALWYLRQIMSFVSPARWGLLIGLTLGVFILLDTAIEPLADDTPGSDLVMVGALLLSWGWVSFWAARRTGRFRDAITAGLLTALGTMLIGQIMTLVRVNVFLEQIRGRADWVGLLARFHASGFQDLRAYANYEYLRGTPTLLAIGLAVGALCGAVAGTVSGVLQRPRSLTMP